MADKKTKDKAPKGRTITNKSGNALVFGLISIDIGSFYVLSDYEVKDELNMAHINRADALNLIDIE